jgi:hypothetical protein
MKIEFKNYPEILAGISEREDGAMVWWNKLPVPDYILKNREKYFSQFGIGNKQVVSGGIAHGTEVKLVDVSRGGEYILNADALITQEKNLFLSVTVADCLPVFFFDSKTESIAMVHAGWRSLVAGILEKTVAELNKNFGTSPNDISVIIGPHIQNCCFEVGEEVAREFNSRTVIRKDSKIFVDLGEEARERLIISGVKNIDINRECTFDLEKYFSARRDKKEPLEGMVAFIGIKK